MRESDRVAVVAVEAAYDAAWNAARVDALVAAFTPDAVIVSPKGLRASGREEIRRLLRDFLAGPARGSRHRSTITDVDLIGADVAVVDGEAALDGIRWHPDAPPETVVHHFTDLLVRTPDGWKLAQVRAYVFLPPLER